MVEAVEKQVKKMTFDDLIDDPKKEEEKAEAFLGYIDSEDKSQGGAGEEKVSGPLTAAPQAIRARQQSCMIKDLDPDEVPEFWKELEAGGGQRKPKLTTKEILKKDTEDEALQRYKRALLGDLADESKFTGEPPLVEFLKIEILCPERPDGPIRLEFSDSKKAGVYKTQEYVLKQKSSIQMRVTFKVYNDIVQGLKLCTVVKKTGFVVEKGDEVLGTFAPVPSREYVIDLQPDETPGGFMARGQYTGKALFIDNDGIVHHQFDYKFNIKKTWD